MSIFNNEQVPIFNGKPENVLDKILLDAITEKVSDIHFE